MIKEKVEIGEANTLLHSLAAVLTDEMRDEMYDFLEEVRRGGNPQELIKETFKFVAQAVRD